MPYRDVPSLTDLGARLRPGWVMNYLLHPHDLRPNLAQTMPRLDLSVEQARDIATYLTQAAPSSLASAITREAKHVAPPLTSLVADPTAPSGGLELG